ncbi:DUF6387 family protein [Aeromonas media]|uniref:DUF6387 family protein n=1 Tax=Aeromonas media TaxID=651 RepID=UPI0015DC717C|nr:DUF6387 family protein [Aeromonas media]BBS88621.1 hypothetical protein WP7W18E02_35180 [Aeromonas media]
MSSGNEQLSNFYLTNKNLTMDYSKLMQLSVEALLEEAAERAKIIHLVKQEEQKKSIAKAMALSYSCGSLRISGVVLDDCVMDFLYGNLEESDHALHNTLLKNKISLYQYLNKAHSESDLEYRLDSGDEEEFYFPKQLELTEAVGPMSLGDFYYYKKILHSVPGRAQNKFDSLSLWLNGEHPSYSMQEQCDYAKITDPRNEVLASIDLSCSDSEILSSLKSLLPSWRESIGIKHQDGVVRERNAPGKSALKKIITNKLIEFMDQMIFDFLESRARTKREIALRVYNDPSDEFINKTVVKSIKQLSCSEYIEKITSYIKNEGIGNKSVVEFMND